MNINNICAIILGFGFMACGEVPEDSTSQISDDQVEQTDVPAVPTAVEKAQATEHSETCTSQLECSTSVTHVLQSPRIQSTSQPKDESAGAQPFRSEYLHNRTRFGGQESKPPVPTL
jgi:hypothetical protein